jgi:hypothetical protein
MNQSYHSQFGAKTVPAQGSGQLALRFHRSFHKVHQEHLPLGWAIHSVRAKKTQALKQIVQEPLRRE